MRVGPRGASEQEDVVLVTEADSVWESMSWAFGESDVKLDVDIRVKSAYCVGVSLETAPDSVKPKENCSVEVLLGKRGDITDVDNHWNGRDFGCIITGFGVESWICVA